MQVRAGCMSWAAAPELQGVYLIFTETLEIQQMFNEVIILAQTILPLTTLKKNKKIKQTGKHINERSTQKGNGKKILLRLL